MRFPSASAVAIADPTTTASAITLDATIRVRPFRFDPELIVEVPVVRSYDPAHAREECARGGRPCLLVLGVDERPPRGWSALEDWVRDSAPPAEFVTRATTIARRADLLQRPCFDHRVVSFRGRTIVVPETQAQLVALLVQQFGEIVTDADIRSLCDDGGVSTHSEAVKTALRRLKDTLAPAGLRLARVRGAGYLLDRAD